MKRLMHKVMAFMARRMIACDEAAYLVSYRSDNKLGLRRWMQLNMHLLSCHLCRKYASQIEQLNRVVHEYAHQCTDKDGTHHLGHDQHQRIEKALVDELGKN